MTPAEAAAELLRRRELRRSFAAWCEFVLAPLGQAPAAHHRLLIDALEALARGDINRLMVAMPPGSAKSTYVSTLFPPWWLAQDPTLSIITASNTAELAERFGRRVRNMIQEHGASLGYGVATDNAAAGRWETTSGGEYYAAGVGGTIMGRRADCLPGNTIVQTPIGDCRLDSVEIGAKTGYVLSYDEENKAVCFRRIRGIARRNSRDIWQIRTVAGRLVEATGSHRFKTGRGWVTASSLAVGDVLVSVVPDCKDGAFSGCEQSRSSWAPDVLRPEMLSGCKWAGASCCASGMCLCAVSEDISENERRSHKAIEGWQGNVLQQLVRDDSRQRREGHVAEGLHGVWQIIGWAVPWGEDMLKRLPDSSAPEGSGIEKNSCSGETVRDLQYDVQSTPRNCGRAILLTDLQGRGSWGRGGWRKQPKLARRTDAEPLSRWERNAVPESQAGCDEARRAGVRDLWVRAEASGASHRHGQHEQRGQQYRHHVQGLSHEASWCGSRETAPDAVAMVERVCRDEDVYDIEVEETACFFANGILVHNCAIIDDPIRSRQDADSQLIRDRIWEWWRDDLTTRMKPGARAAIVATRWHEDDLSGRLLNDMATGGEPWHVLSLPMEAELQDPLGRQPGERLWSDWFTPEMVATAKRDSRTWSALYQQRPSPETGDYFKRDYLRTVPTLPPRASLRVFGASDYAVTAGGGDWTVHIIVGVDSDDRLYILDLWRAQASSDVWVEAFCDLVIQWKPMGWAEETGQIRASLGPWLDRRSRERRAFVARTQFPTRGDKTVRAQSIRGRAALSGLHIPADALWRADLEAEMMSFPAGKHDDQCLAEGTLISMADGTARKIENVFPGDWVSTPDGPCEVEVSAVTSPAAPVYRITLQDGTMLTATGNHPVMVREKGFVRVDALGIMDHLEMEPLLCAEVVQRPMLLSIAGIVTAAILKASTRITGTTTPDRSRVEVSCTGTSGKTSAAQSLMVMTSTIATKTRLTTTYRISSAFLSKSIDSFIRRVWMTSGLHISQGSAVPLPYGMGAMPALSGTASMVVRPGKGASPVSPKFAPRVALRSWLHSSEPLTAQKPVSSVGRAEAEAGAGVLSRAVKRSPANAAIATSLRSGQIPLHTVPRRAGCVIGIEALSDPAKVRNLTVSRAHTFYANGILTHNCDALGLVGQLLDRMLPPPSAKPPAEPVDPWNTAFKRARNRDSGNGWKTT